MKRDEKRKDTRTGARGAIMMAAFMVSTVMMMTGCQSATPSATSNDSDMDNNTVTINNTVNIYPVFPTATNEFALASTQNAFAKSPTPIVLPALSFSVSDVMGTQSTSAEGGSNSQDMTPTMTPGITGDKPIEKVADTVKSALSAGATSAVDTAADTASTLTGSVSGTNATTTATQ